jgi:hypothetical protein
MLQWDDETFPVSADAQELPSKRLGKHKTAVKPEINLTL